MLPGLCILLSLSTLADPGVRLTVDLGPATDVKLVGAVNRWDADGNHRRPVDPKARIDAPAVDFSATHSGGGTWIFPNLPPGRYDLLILGKDRLRIEGFTFAPVLEFDPFFPPDATTDDETRQLIVDDIKKSPHYENKVVPLYLGGDKKAVRVLVMLMRDQPTSYTPGSGTIRHEIWQYTWQHGAWQKEKRTKVLDRILMQVSELHRWTWLWDPKLGGVEVKNQPLTIRYEVGRAEKQAAMKP